MNKQLQKEFQERFGFIPKKYIEKAEANDAKPLALFWERREDILWIIRLNQDGTDWFCWQDGVVRHSHFIPLGFRVAPSFNLMWCDPAQTELLPQILHAQQEPGDNPGLTA